MQCVSLMGWVGPESYTGWSHTTTLHTKHCNTTHSTLHTTRCTLDFAHCPAGSVSQRDSQESTVLPGCSSLPPYLRFLFFLRYWRLRTVKTARQSNRQKLIVLPGWSIPIWDCFDNVLRYWISKPIIWTEHFYVRQLDCQMNIHLNNQTIRPTVNMTVRLTNWLTIRHLDCWIIKILYC